MTKEETQKTDGALGADKPDGHSAFSLQLDPDDYRECLCEFELTEDQEAELLQALWNIMSSMVDIGWGVDSVQMFLPAIFEKSVQDSGKLLGINDARELEETNEKDTEHA